MKKLWAKFGSNITKLFDNEWFSIHDFLKKRKEAFFPKPVRLTGKSQLSHP